MMIKAWKLMKLLLTATFPQNIRLIFQDIRRRIYKNETDYGLYFDLTLDFKIPESKIPFAIKELTVQDVMNLCNYQDQDIDNRELKDRLERILFIQSGIGSCYGGVTSDDELCVICWLVDSSENDNIQSYFGDGILDLERGDVLYEYIYTNSKYRGFDLMRIFTHMLFHKARREGARRALAYIHDSNRNSLNAVSKIGWKPFVVKKIAWRFFKRTITFFDYVEAAKADVEQYDSSSGS